jgi:hypothetical protein
MRISPLACLPEFLPEKQKNVTGVYLRIGYVKEGATAESMAIYS